MANEFRLNFTGSEINRKLEVIDELQGVLEHNYYTSDEIDTKIDEVSTDINVKFGAAGSSLEAGLATKADLVGGKVPIAQLPDDLVDLSNYYTKSDVDNEIIIVNEDTDAKLVNKADLVDGKVPLEQLPDDIGGTVSVEDVEGLMVKTTVSETATIWEYYDGMVADTELVADGMTQYLYKISDSIDPNDFVDSIISTAGGQDIVVTSDMISFDTGIFYVINASMGEIMIFPTDLDWSNLGMSGITSAGSYALRLVADTETSGAAKIQAMTEAVKSIINPDLLSNVASNVFWKDIIGRPFYEEKGESITWDGNTEGLTSISSTIEMPDEGVIATQTFYKVSDTFLSTDVVNGATFVGADNSEYIVDDSYAQPIDSGSYIYMDNLMFASIAQAGDVLTVGEMLTFTFSEPGVWFCSALTTDTEGNILQEMTLSGTLKLSSTLVQIDEKFIPDTIARKSDLDAAISSLDSALTSAIGSGVLS